MHPYQRGAMRHIARAAGLLLILWSAPAFAQQADPAAANRALIGEGPKVDVQQSAIGTLDVGGAGAANPKVTGENLRGNFGASVPPATPQSTAAPNLAVPNYSLQAPNLGPDLQGAAPGQRPTKEQMRAVEDLILPRYRSAASKAASHTALTEGVDGWRYRYFNNRWWYWRPSNSWAYWDGNQWREATSRN